MFSFSFVSEFSVRSVATLLAVVAAALGVEGELLLLFIIGEFVSKDRLVPMSTGKGEIRHRTALTRSAYPLIYS